MGYLNVQGLVQEHKLTDSFSKRPEFVAKEMNVYNEILKAHYRKPEQFNKGKAGYSEFIKASKEKELVVLASKIQEFNSNAPQQFQKGTWNCRNQFMNR